MSSDETGKTMSPRRWVEIVEVFVSLALLAACSPKSSSPATWPTPHLRWSTCGERLECSHAKVPLDWSRRGGAQITLAIIRHIASRPRKRIGSLFFNPGGPGVSGIDTVKGAGADLDILSGGRFDIVSWDPRGIGASTPVRCFSDEVSLASFWDHRGIPTTKAASPPYLRKTVGFARRCGASSGTLLRHISTADTARDLDYLRELLGDQRLTYLGWSYGSFLGIVYANMFPDRVRAMAVDGIVDPVPYTTGREAFLANDTADADLVFEKFESLCQRVGRSRCALAGHGPVSPRVNRLLARLRRAAIQAPSAPGGKLTYGDALTAFFSLLRSPGGWPGFARDLKAAQDGDGSALENLARITRSPSGYRLLEPSVAIGCADGPAQQKPQAWPQVIERLTHVSFIDGPLLGWWIWAPCASWPVTDANRYTGPWNAATRIPILVIGTRFDPNTPFTNAQRLAHLLGNATLLTHDGYGHTSTADPSTCVERAERRYFVGLIVPARGTVCASDHPPFDPNFGKPPPSAPSP
jgi:pimeloyl-ACP methyl ester carboxylesterase